MNRPLEVLPKHLNRIEVKTLTGPLQKAHFLLLKPFCCSFNSVLWIVVWLHHQNFCWTSVGGQMAWKMCTVCSIMTWKCFIVCVICLNRTCLSIIVSFMINTQKSHAFFLQLYISQIKATMWGNIKDVSSSFYFYGNRAWCCIRMCILMSIFL